MNKDVNHKILLCGLRMSISIKKLSVYVRMCVYIHCLYVDQLAELTVQQSVTSDLNLQRRYKPSDPKLGIHHPQACF